MPARRTDSTEQKSRLEEYRKKRDFSRTAEPSGEAEARSTGLLRFVIQKHDASHLHYDLRLEMEGVMRSWAVPKGPSLNPRSRRLAMEVEDHPIGYNDFEGTIPKGEYGGGTVMLWDTGHYIPKDAAKKEDAETAALRGYNEGKLGITFYGERLRGSYNLVRTEKTEEGPRSKWLFFKIKDQYASTELEITEAVTESVVSGRTMEEIAEGRGGKRVWHSNRDGGEGGEEGGGGERTPDLGSLEPMLAVATRELPRKGDWVYEPKYDGIRVLALASATGVALVTRNGHDKSAQFPEVVEALEALVEETGSSVILDGEIVALTDGHIGRFELLQGRMHVTGRARIGRLRTEQPAGFVAFDVLLAANDVLVQRKWAERRRRLEGLLEDRATDTLRLASVEEDADKLVAEAEAGGWEGIMAKRRDAPYRPGERSRTWLKYKLESSQEFVVGGWTEPRKSRSHLGALLLGYYDGSGELVYAGHTGTGFSGDSLADMARRLKPLERKTSPFNTTPKSNEKAHWVTPRVVVEVRFNEWTKEGRLRQPVFLGVREDKDAADVTREDAEEPIEGAEPESMKLAEPDVHALERIRELESTGRGGAIKLGGKLKLPVTSLRKVFFPETGHTKADVLAYYVTMESLILPWMDERPLVLKRFPNGVEGESFYQQAAPDTAPDGVRIEEVDADGKVQRRLVGGNLITLLYTVQLGAISFDPWHTRVSAPESADYTILDLDPGPGADFRTAVQVARVVKEEMDELGVHGALKTSGSRGLHIYLPLPPATPLDAATLIAQIIATRVARRIPDIATVERMTKNRPEGTVYVDYLQNILGKTVAGVYSVRAKEQPTVSTPLRWSELADADLDLKAFTIDTVPDRVREIGDLWSPAMAEPISIENMLRAHGVG